MPAPRVHSGYTVIELMAVIVIVGLLAMVAVPSFNGAIDRNARDSYVMDLQAAVGTARAEAVTSGSSVSICRSTDQSNCAAGAGGADWNDGWIIFTDGDRDGVVEATDTTIDTDNDGAITVADPVLEAQGSKNGLMVVTLIDGAAGGGDVTGDFITFTPQGFLDDQADGAYFKLCSPDNELEYARGILLNLIGRPSLSGDTGPGGTPNGVHEDISGNDLVCP